MISFLPLLILLGVPAVWVARRRTYVPFRSRLKGLVLASSIVAVLSLLLRGELFQLLRGDAATPRLVGYAIGEAVGSAVVCLISALVATGARQLLDALFKVRMWAIATTIALVLGAILLFHFGIGLAVGAVVSIVLLGILVHGVYLGLTVLHIISVPRPAPEHDRLKQVFE